MTHIPEDILQSILEVGCKFEFEELPKPSYPEWSRSYSEARRSRRCLKPFVRPLAGVCREWREVILRTPSFWISRFDAMPGDEWNLKEIFGETKYDLDLSLQPCEVENHLGWIKTQFLPFSHRYQTIVMTISSQNCANLLFRELALVQFPRLLQIVLNFRNRVVVEAPNFGFIAPRLLSFIIGPVPWKVEESHFHNLTRLGLKQQNNLPWSRWELCTSLNTCSFSLVALSLQLSIEFENEVFSEETDPVIHLPRLSQLYISTTFISSLIRIMEILDIPALANLVVETIGNSDDIRTFTTDIERISFRAFKLGSSLQYLAAHVHSVWFPYFLARLSMPMIEELNLVAYGNGDLKLHHRQILGSEKVRLEKLHRLCLTWVGSNDQWFAWLLENFDLSATSIMNITFGNHLREIKRLVLPNLEGCNVSSLIDLDYILAPALRHLAIPLSDLHKTNPWPKILEAEQIPIDRITYLQLKLNTSLTHYTRYLEAKLFRPFREVTSLTITHLPILSREYRWPVCWKKRTGAGKGLLKKKPEILFPKLVALQVDIPEVSTMRLGSSFSTATKKEQHMMLKKMLSEIQSFILSRRRLGYPIRSLRLNYIPESLGEKITRLTREVDKFEVGEHFHELSAECAGFVPSNSLRTLLERP